MSEPTDPQAALRARAEKLALAYHKAMDGSGEGEYGCPGVECPGVKRLTGFLLTSYAALVGERPPTQDEPDPYRYVREVFPKRGRCQWHDTEFLEMVGPGRKGRFYCALCANESRILQNVQPASDAASPLARLQGVRREINDKLHVANASDLSTYQGKVAFRQCEEFLVELFDAEVRALEARLQQQAEELERERIRLAACTTAALGNTPARVAERITPEHPYWSASYGDVCAAVDREMSLREQLEALEARLRAVVEKQLDWIDTESYIVDVREKFKSATAVFATVVDRSTAMHALLFVRAELDAILRSSATRS